MNDNTELIDKVLDLCRNKCDECDVMVSTGEGTPVEFESNRLKNIHSKQYQSISLRMIKDGKLGIAATDIFDDPETLVNNCIESAKYGSEVSFSLPEKADYPDIPLYDEAIEKVSIDDMLKCGQSLIDAITKLDKNLICEGGISKSTATSEFASSKGLHGSVKMSSFGMYIGGTIVNGTDMLFLGDGDESCKVDWDTQKIINTVTEQYERTRTQATVKSGMLPVIFSPSGFSDAFVPCLCEGFNGKLVYEGASPLTGKIGEKVFDEKFFLIDDATVPYRTSSRLFDGEGVKSQKLELIKDGTVCNFMYDLKTAHKAGTRSTGHGGRTGGIGPSNLVLKPGIKTQKEMIAEIEEGLLIEELMGAEQGNVLGGDFSGNVLLGYKIEKGQIAGRVKDTVVSGNIYELLKNIQTIGSDIKWNGDLYAPSILFPAVSCASHKE